MRMLVRAEVRVAAPPQVVWDYVTDWPRQGEWIPFTHVEVVPTGGDVRARQVGGRFRAWTGIGPVGFWDPITLTAWQQRADGTGRVEIMHTGRVVRGDAEFSVLADGPDACRVGLWEHLEIPGGPVGGLLWRLLRPVLGPVLDRGAGTVLRRMAQRAESLREGSRG